MNILSEETELTQKNRQGLHKEQMFNKAKCCSPWQ